MSARPISEREWLKGAQHQAEDWYIRRRAEMRESFARMWAGES